MSDANDQNQSAPSDRVLTGGTLIGHYRIIEKIGAGGMGEVYLAEDTGLNRRVALKFLPTDLCRDDDCRARFTREAQAAAKLNHSNIVTIYEVADYQGRPFIAMEYVEGLSLDAHIKEKALSLGKIIELAIQICEGLAKAHQAGIVHRDIKPSNILMDQDGRAKILDFGLATIKGTDKLTKTGSTLGTLSYMSPEQTRGEDVDHRSDIFSFGTVLYEMITGQLPFKGDHEPAIVYSIGYEEPEPLARYKTGVPDELQRIVSKALAKSKEERYQHADDLLADLRKFSKRGLPSATEKPRRDMWNRYVVTAAVAVILAIVGYWGVTKFLAKEEQEAESTRKMLAVLPFENLGSPDDEYFADGITDEITGKLATIHELGVISRTSTMQYKKTTKNLRQIAKELGVDYILEGTIRWDKSSDTSRVRILPQLIRVSDDTHLWAETYERPVTGIFALQTEIASRIAETMNIALKQPENTALRSLPTNNLEAYQMYLRGMDFQWRGFDIRENCQLAVQMFQRAVILDSTFALAYAELARALSGMFHFGHDRTPERCSQSKEAADRVTALQPDLPNSHIAQGYYYYWCCRDYELALRELALAEVGLPNNPQVLLAQGAILRRQGDFRGAAEKLKRAFTVAPRDYNLAGELGATYFRLRDYSDGEKLLNQAIYLAPDVAINYTDKADLYCSWRADTAMARSTLEMFPSQNNEEIRRQWFWLHIYERNYPAALGLLGLMPPEIDADLAPDSIGPKAQLAGMLYDLAGDSERARACYDYSLIVLKRTVKERPDDRFGNVHSSLGLAYAGLGRKDDAIREAKRGVELFPVSHDAVDGVERLENLSQIYVRVGEYDAALDVIEQLLSMPGRFSIPRLQLCPWYDPLRKLPRYQKLLEKYGA